MRHTTIIGAVLAALTAVVVLAGCSPATTPVGTPSTIHAMPSAASPSPKPTVDTSGLVTALHAQCDLGTQIMRYLATGNNEGNPQLDQAFAQYVGVPTPQARSIADQAIQNCDANASKAEASASAAAAEASQAAAEAQASAQAAQAKAALRVVEQQACSAIGGRVDQGGWNDTCKSANPGRSSDGHYSCSIAVLGFQPDGTLARSDVADLESATPGCFK